MKQVLSIVTLLMLAGLFVTTVYAVTPKAGAKPTLSSVTVAVDGLSSPACATDMQAYLSKLKGVSDVKVIQKPGQVTAKLDEKVITASSFIISIDSHACKAMAKCPYTAHLTFYVDAPMCKGQAKMCPACEPEISKMLKSVKGISKVSFDTTGRYATVSFAPKAKVSTSDITSALNKSTFHFTENFASALSKTPSSKAAATNNKMSAGCPMNGGGCCGMK